MSSEAEAAVLRDVDFCADGLAAACMGCGDMPELPHLTVEEAHELCESSLPVALQILLDDGQSEAAHRVARRAMRQLLLDQPGTKLYAAQLGQRQSIKLAEDDIADREELAARGVRTQRYWEAA